MKLKKSPATIQKLEKEIIEIQKAMLRVYAKFAQLETREKELIRALREEAKSAKFQLGRVARIRADCPPPWAKTDLKK